MISAGLLVADLKFQQLAGVKSALGTITTPLYWFTNVRSQLADWTEQNFASRRRLQEENARLQSESLILKGKLQKLAALVAENGRLRALLKSSALVHSDDITIAEMIGLVSVPGRHEVFINKGMSDQVYVGQPVLDSEGLMGQVAAVNLFSSRVILITDINHAVPVNVNRSGLRGIVAGMGRYDRLDMTDVPLSADIQVGDILETSGLDHRFPAGYPVARVTGINRAPGQPFLTVWAQPLARLDRSRYLLLVSASRQQ